ncbi:MAG: uL13 family ribosomal protein [archaeon]
MAVVDKTENEEKETGAQITVVDAEGAILGRAASLIAKRILSGEKIDVINADKAFVSVHSAEDYLIKSKRGGRDWGPYMPKNAALWFRRTVRGMVPRGITRGRIALKRFRAYEGVPAKFVGVPAEKIAQKTGDTIHKYVTLKGFSMLKLGKTR